MNRGHVLQSSPVQQMMAAGNPSWWNINSLMRPPMLSSPSSSSTSNLLAPLPNNNNHHHHHHHHNEDDNNVFHAQYTMSMPTAAASSSSWLDDHHHHPPTNHHQLLHQQLPESWSQLLLGGVIQGEEAKKMEATNWEEQVVLQQQPQLVDVKQENSVNSYSNNHNNNNNVYGTHAHDQDFRLAAAKAANWSHHLPQLNIPVSSPQSCVTSFSTSGNNLLDFSSSISSDNNLRPTHPPPAPDRASECNSSTATGGAAKKAKVQSSSTQSTTPAFKVRKEKLGDRITALHQLVSPFGKTDTASVLLEAIGYIRFLQSQIEALSLPYLNSGAGNNRQPHTIQGERKCIFPEDPGQLLNDNCLKRKGGPDQDSCEEPKDLKSRGLCLVPLSCTLHVGSDNGADYWAPALGGGFR